MNKPLIILAAILPLLVSCASTKIANDWDREVDFTTYGTFAFDSTGETSLLEAAVSLEVGKRLVEKGFSIDTGNPDLLVYVRGSASGHIAFATDHIGYQPSAGWSDFYGWGWGGYGGQYVAVRNVAVGTAVIDIVDADQRRLVWRGVAQKTVNTDRFDSERVQKRITAITKTMFRKFPPK